MARSIVFSVMVALSVGVVATQEREMVIEVEQLEDNLYVLRGQGGGGNTGVFVTGDGVVVVDTKNPGWGQPILEAIRELTSNPVTTLVNTHSHGDHVSGNVAFASSVEIVARRAWTPDAHLHRSVDDRQWSGQGGPLSLWPCAHRWRRLRGVSGLADDACGRRVSRQARAVP